jgi:hypothetical protein
VFGALGSCSRTRTALQLEIIALRHQVNVLRRSKRRRVRLSRADRLLWTWLRRHRPGWRSALVIVKPETVVRWHRKGFRLFWTWNSRRTEPGRPELARETRDFIRKMSLANPLWGAPRIHGELLKLGIEVCEATVGKYLVRGRKPPISNLARLSQQPCFAVGFRGFLRGAHCDFSAAVRFRGVGSSAEASDSLQRHHPFQFGMDGTANRGSLSLG